MPRTDERRAALRFCLLAAGWLGCLFGWACLLSFSAADSPSTTVWPNADPPHNLCGTVGAWLAYHAMHYVGLAAYPFLALWAAALFGWSRGVPFTDLWLRVIGLALVILACSAGAQLAVPHTTTHLLTGPGGALGTSVAGYLLPRLDALGTTIVLTMTLIVGLILAADNLLLSLFRGARWAGQRSAPALARGRSAVATASSAVASSVSTLSERFTAARETRNETPATAQVEPGDVTSAADVEDDEEYEEEEEWEYVEEDVPEDEAEAEEYEEDAEEDDEVVESASAPARALLIKDLRPKAAPPPPKPIPRINPEDDDYELPDLDLLERPIPVDKSAIENLCREKAYILEQTLNEFRLEVEVVAIETGPVITVFELKLAPGIKVSQIASLTNDMARALKAPAVRVVAPLPGKNTIGIEVPNIDKEKVRLRDVMEAASSRLDQLAVPLFLGKDASGQPLVADLTRMPHLLIAGTTGSGKSVCVNSIIMSVLLTRAPSEVNMVLVDPKVVELAMYKDVPHLMCPIVTDTAKAEGILDWASTKMDERYALLAEAGVKDIRSYNRLGYDKLKERLNASDEEMARIPSHLPYIVIIIDELADLMMTSAKEVEFFLCRIAQKSRAVGIHLIVSTQRPQANVVTGLIKSNLPCRIAFRVSSRLDSRIVLDQNGGEVLMGQGDMLFLPPGSSKLVRAQGTFIADDELRAIVAHAREQREPQFHPELVRLKSPGDTAGTTERDELFDKAVDVILETGRGSVSLLQRRLTIGYGRASRLVDQMHEAGIVGDYKGSQAREVIISKDEWAAIRNQRDAEESDSQENYVEA